MDESETTRLRALLKRAELPERGYCVMDLDTGHRGVWAHTAKGYVHVATVVDHGEVGIEARAQLFAAIPTALPGLLDAAERAERAERERDALTAQRDAARADHAAAEAHLAGIVSRWEAADHDSQSIADLHVPGLRAEIEEARDGREGEWWEVSRGGNPAPLRTELAAIRAQLAAVTAERDALRAERDGEHDLIARQAAILTAVANALKGPPPALSSHSHHDLGAVAAATVAQQAPLVACVDALRAAATSAGWRDADATGEHLVAWVRRGGACKGRESMRAAAQRACDAFPDATGYAIARAIRALPLDAPGGGS